MSYIADPDSSPETNAVVEHSFDGDRDAEETLLVGPDGIESTISCESDSRESSPNSMSEEVPFPTNILSAPEPLAASESIDASSLLTTQYRPRGQIDRKSVTQPRRPKKKDSREPGKLKPSDPAINNGKSPNPPNPKAPKPAPADPGKKDGN